MSAIELLPTKGRLEVGKAIHDLVLMGESYHRINKALYDGYLNEKYLKALEAQYVKHLQRTPQWNDDMDNMMRRYCARVGIDGIVAAWLFVREPRRLRHLDKDATAIKWRKRIRDWLTTNNEPHPDMALRHKPQLFTYQKCE